MIILANSKYRNKLVKTVKTLYVIKSFMFYYYFQLAQPFLNDISTGWSIWMQNSVMESLLVVDYMTEKWM
jgi:hypothetical protein